MPKREGELRNQKEMKKEKEKASLNIGKRNKKKNCPSRHIKLLPSSSQLVETRVRVFLGGGLL